MKRLRIGEVAKAAGLSVEAVRYYEQRGLLDKPARNESGYREYPTNTIARLGFIHRGKKLGFSLQEIKELLDLQASPEADSSSVKSLLLDKIALVDTKILELTRLKADLAMLSESCDGQGARKQCPILGFLETGEETLAD